MWDRPFAKNVFIISMLCVLGRAPRDGWAQDCPVTSSGGLPTEYDAQGRTAVRGCPVGTPCRDPLTQEISRFEWETFGPTGGQAFRSSPQKLAARPKSIDPLSLRPDLPWLANLKMPDLPIAWDLRTIRFLEFYKNDPRGQGLMRAWLKRQGRYKNLILSHLRAAKLPEDLLYVGMVESAYDPLDYSRVGASGLWQFMPAGGRIYGMSQTRWLDERNDPYKSTRMVTDYFADLYERFGNWELALAAFNTGYGAVLKSIAKYNTNDFWTLLNYENALPWESSVYVPKAMACAIIGHNRELFGFADVVPDPEIAVEGVELKGGISLSLVAKLVGIPLADLKQINPHFRKDRTPPKQLSTVYVPTGTASKLRPRLAELEQEANGYVAVTLRHGERLEDVATTYGITINQLKIINQMDHTSEAIGGTDLLVPVIAAGQKQENRKKAEESLYAASEPEGKVGEPLTVAVKNPGQKVPGKKQLWYRVVTGDSLSSVANAFTVSRIDLATWNNLDSEAHLHPKMVLTVWVRPNFDAEAKGIAVLAPERLDVIAAASPAHVERAEARIGRQRIIYTAKRRETYEQIAKQFGLTSRDLGRINQKSYDSVLEPGQTCIVYKVVDPNASERAEKQARQMPGKTRKTPKAPAKPERKKK